LGAPYRCPLVELVCASGEENDEQDAVGFVLRVSLQRLTVKKNVPIEAGTCWVRRSDHMMVQILEIDGEDAVWSVLCGGVEAPGDEGRTPKESLRTLFFPVTDDEATMREEYEVQERSVRQVAERYGFSSYTAYYRLKRVGTEFRPGGVRPGKEYPRSLVLLENLEVTYDHWKQSRDRGNEGRGIAKAIATELGLSESRAYQLRRIVVTVYEGIQQGESFHSLLDRSGLDNQDEVLRKLIAYMTEDVANQTEA
jgi:hypothetical protein